MSLFFYGIFILGVVLGGLVLLVIFSLLAMAQKGDESLEKLEIEMLQTQECGSLAYRGGYWDLITSVRISQRCHFLSQLLSSSARYHKFH
jgi:hypothetical protein